VITLCVTVSPGLAFKGSLLQEEWIWAFCMDLRTKSDFVPVAHETAICRNPPMHSFMGNGKKEKTLQIISRPTLKHVMFLRNYKGKQLLLWAQQFDGTRVSNTGV
jgi:hypothetical protein